MSLSLDTLGTLILCITLLALALFVVLHNPRAPVNRRFGLSAFAIAGWIFSISFALSATNLQHTISLGRFGFAFASAIPFTLFWLFDAFRIPHPHRSRFTSLLPAAFCVLFIGLSLSPLIVAGATPNLPKANFIYGPVHKFFGIYFLLAFIFALYTLWRTTRSVTGLRNLQLRYLLLGVLLGGAGAITTNLIIPLVANTSRYSALGPYFSLLVVSFSAHAIIRYRLMDIRVVIKQGVVYVCAILSAGSVFLIAANIFTTLTGYEHNDIPITGALALALILAVLFQPLKHRIQLSFNRYLYRETYDYPRTIRDATRRLSTLLELDALLDYLTHTVDITFKTEGVLIYLRESYDGGFTPKLSSSLLHWAYAHPALPITPSASIVTILQSGSGTFVREEAAHTSHHATVDASQFLLHLGMDLACALRHDNVIVGIIFIGPKRSGDPYFPDDIDLLETLAGQAAVAMKNAQLYREVVLVNKYIDNILSTMDSGVIATNMSGHISLFNPTAERLTRITASTILGRHYTSLPAALAAPLHDTFEKQIPRSQFELSIETAGGLETALLCSTAVLVHGSNDAHGALIVFSDLTRLKELEREKRRAERLASFGALASGVAHEIKNPLVAIRTFAELLPERFADTDFREDFAKVVVREISRIDGLVARLRGIAASAPQQAGTTDIREPILDTLRLLRAQLEQTRTTVHRDFLDSAPLVAVDDAQLKQLFLNLFLNAIEAMGTGGELSVHLERRELQGQQWIVVDISDIGPGIPDTVRTNIFDPFFTTKPRGSGLGLAICRGITDAHRGRIRAANRTDRTGTTMTIELPAVASIPLPAEEHILRR